MNPAPPPPDWLSSAARVPGRVARELRREARQVYQLTARGLLLLLGPVLRLCGWRRRFTELYVQRIGHLAAEPDVILKEEAVGLRSGDSIIWLAVSDQVCNECLLGYWSRRIRVWRMPGWMAFLLRPLVQDRWLGFDTRPYFVAINSSARYPQIQAAWGRREPLLALTPMDLQRGRESLQRLGVPADAWFVCFHCREPGFFSGEIDHSHRDADVLTFIPAMQAVTALGGWCIRMGDPSMQPLPTMERVIDYARHEAKSDWMDVFLCANCRCLVGTSSGLALVASVFGVPAAMTNYLPASGVLPYGGRDLGIPKLLWSERDRRLMTFPEIFDSPAANFRFTRLYVEAGLRPVNNTAEEIRELTLELLEVAAGTASYTLEDEERQRRFKALLRPGHYCHGAPARVGRDFLRRHEALLPSA